MKTKIYIVMVLIVSAILFVSCKKDSKDDPQVDPSEEPALSDWTYRGAIQLNSETMKLNGNEVTDTKVEYVHDETSAGIDTLKLYEVIFSPKQPFALQIVRLAVKKDANGQLSQIEDEQAAEYLFNGSWLSYENHKFTQTKGTVSAEGLTLDTYCGTVNITYSGKRQNNE